jgi:hypothetical protein
MRSLFQRLDALGATMEMIYVPSEDMVADAISRAQPIEITKWNKTLLTLQSTRLYPKRK